MTGLWHKTHVIHPSTPRKSFFCPIRIGLAHFKVGLSNDRLIHLSMAGGHQNYSVGEYKSLKYPDRTSPALNFQLFPSTSTSYSSATATASASVPASTSCPPLYGSRMGGPTLIEEKAAAHLTTGAIS
jgi:hypothetical protein